MDGLLAKLRDGPRVRVTADHYVLSAGAVGSSYLLLRSHAATDLPVGQRLCFNMGAPLTAEFEDVQDAYAGLQISHYGIPRDSGFVFETWFNPPVAQALNMPGWFEQHFENMRRYPHLGGGRRARGHRGQRTRQAGAHRRARGSTTRPRSATSRRSPAACGCWARSCSRAARSA